MADTYDEDGKYVDDGRPYSAPAPTVQEVWDPYQNRYVTWNPYTAPKSPKDGESANSRVAQNWVPRTIPIPTQAYQTGLPSYLQMPQMRQPLQTQPNFQFPSYNQGQWQNTLEGIYQRVLGNILGSQSGSGAWYRRLLG